jgi:Mce-associated membrane protein
VLTGVLGVLLVTALVVAAVLGWQYRQGRQAEQARGEALAAAQKAAPVVLSYDYRHLDRDFARARALLTGHFLDQYGRTTKTVVAPTATKYHGVVKATVATPTDGGAPAASVVSATPDRAVVLLFVNQVTQSTRLPQPRLDLNRVRLTLTHTSAGWKVSGVDAL